MKKLFKLFTKKDKLFALIAIILIVLATVCDLFIPYLFSEVMNIIVANNDKNMTWTHELTLYFSIMFMLAFLSISLTITAVKFSTTTAINVSTKLRMNAYNKTQYLSSSNINEITTSSLITRITSDIVQIQLFLVMLFSTFVKATSFIIGAFSFSLYQIISFSLEENASPEIWYLAFTYLLPIVLLLLMGTIIGRATPLFKLSRNAVDNNNIIMEENIAGNRLIRAFNLQKQQSLRYEKGNKNLKQTSIKTDNIMVLIMPMIIFVMNMVSIFIVMFSGIYSINNNSLAEIAQTIKLIGIIQSFLSYFMLMLLGLSLMGMVGYNFTRAKTCTTRIFEIINKENEIKSGDNDSLINTANIEFKNVSFKYHKDSKIEILKNLNFKIKNGETLGIIGQTGSGKSTLINLLLRLYDVNSGSILINDIDIKDYKLNNLRNGMTISLQDKVLIRGTVKSNIMIGNLNASEKELMTASKHAEAFEFINKLDDKFNAPVEQKGKNFSGGQQQRISIARALIKKAKILIFDDSTSALDNITENKLLKNLDEYYNDSTKIIVSQKTRTIKNCDSIIVLKNGSIVEKGKHKELLKLNGIYKSIHDSQESSME